MAGTNTEKPTGKNEKRKQLPTTKSKKEIPKSPITKAETKKEALEKKPGAKKEETKKPVIKKIKKESASVSARNLPISTKVAASICKFMKNKKIEKTISELEAVSKMKKAVPMKGEYAHRKGKIMSGKFPVKAAKEFLVLVKSLKSNAIYNDIEEPRITEAIANKGTTTYASGGRQKKRTHVKLVCSNKKTKEKKE